MEAAVVSNEAAVPKKVMALTVDWLEESKKINDAILLYEKMNDMAYFNQSTLSDESKKMAGPKKLKLKVALTQIRGSKTTPIKGSKMARFVHGIQESGS